MLVVAPAITADQIETFAAAAAAAAGTETESEQLEQNVVDEAEMVTADSETTPSGSDVEVIEIVADDVEEIETEIVAFD